MQRGLREERGVEPLAMKIMAGVILLVIGLGIGLAVYKWAGGWATAIKCNVSLEKSSTTISVGENETIRVDISIAMGAAETVTLDATGEPSGVTVTFSPQSGEPPFYSNMTINVGSGATASTYVLTILVKDSKGATSGSVPFDLTVQ